MDARMPVTHKEGDRYPLGPPNLFPMSNLGEGSGLLIREAWFESTMGSQFYPSVAQPGSASGLGPEGREFEPLHSDQLALIV